MGRKYNIPNELREAVEHDLKEGMKLKPLAEKHGVGYEIIQSIFGTYNLKNQAEKIQKGTAGEKWENGVRMRDGKPSPVTSFNINDLTNEELRERGLERFIKSE
ncbi:hypothetical protein [Bacillus haynesii]|uniref:hypothetical protein n=1 Tax=Bacillus haynesii TaxID=1925021 RepID=UPI00228117B4|nr:hypothetical protein [Bacillus haynesii]MCY7861597.1 hypothetical protein [Bacillus haynesii]MCY9153913.1 hypothetical protein [Bacillus haynesii]